MDALLGDEDDGDGNRDKDDEDDEISVIRADSYVHMKKINFDELYDNLEDQLRIIAYSVNCPHSLVINILLFVIPRIIR